MCVRVCEDVTDTPGCLDAAGYPAHMFPSARGQGASRLGLLPGVLMGVVVEEVEEVEEEEEEEEKVGPEGARSTTARGLTSMVDAGMFRERSGSARARLEVTDTCKID